MSDTVIVACVAATGSVLTTVISAFVLLKTRDTHRLINSRMDELLKLTSTEAFGRGERAAQAQAQAQVSPKKEV